MKASEIIDILVETEHIEDSFRLWVTTEVHEEFPIGLLQMAIKFTNEPPQEIRASMKRSYQSFRAMSAIITNHLPNSNKNTEGSKSLLKELIGIVKECQTSLGPTWICKLVFNMFRNLSKNR